MAKSKIILENENNVGTIPICKKPLLIPKEEMFFYFHYYGWSVVQLWIKRTEGIEKYGKERFEELSKAKNSIRARDRYFLHKFIPEEMFKGAEIQHFWHENMADTYDYCCIWTRDENQVIELRKLKKMGWQVEKMVHKLEEILSYAYKNNVEGIC